jgi:hypothetical protein
MRSRASERSRESPALGDNVRTFLTHRFIVRRCNRWLDGRHFRSALALVVFSLLAVVSASAGTVTGVVRNGTSGKPAAGVDVILIQLQGGMESVANTKTDAQGNFKFDHPSIGQQPMLIRAVYRGVMFHQPLPPGRSTADVNVYEPSSDAKTIQVGSRLIVFQPNGANLLVGEEYSLRNETQPPVAYFNEKGNFEFQIPEGAQLSQVSSWGPSGMPVVQGTMDRGNRKYAIAYAFQPGENGVRLSYQLPYPSNQAKLRFSSAYAVQRVMLVVPPTVQVDSPGFTAAGTEQGFNLYTREGVPSGLPFDVSLSGTALPPSASQQGQGSDAGGDQVNGRDSGPAVQALPNRLDSLKWIIIGGFAALFALGVLLLWRTPVPLAVEAAGAAPVPAASRPPGRARKQTRSAPASSPVKAAPEPARPGSAEVDRSVQQSLDGLKDRLFRLELRRQAGTISEEEYARERNQAEQILREMVRG